MSFKGRKYKGDKTTKQTNRLSVKGTAQNKRQDLFNVLKELRKMIRTLILEQHIHVLPLLIKLLAVPLLDETNNTQDCSAEAAQSTFHDQEGENIRT